MASATDNFNRANETPLAAPWTKLGGSNVNLASNKLAKPSGSDDAMYVRSDAAFTHNQYAQMRYDATVSSNDWGVVVRGSLDGTSSTYNAYLGTAFKAIGKFVNGAWSTIVDCPSLPDSVPGSTVIRLEVEGSTLRLYYDGVQATETPVTDTSIATGSPGFIWYEPSGSLDDWAGGDLVEPSSPKFVQAGTGVEITGTTGTVSITGCTAGNLIVLQVLEAGGATFPFLSSVTNLQNLAGTTGTMETSLGSDIASTQIGGTLLGAELIWVGRVTANGTCSVQLNVTANDLVARFYEFSQVSTAGTLAEILDYQFGNPTDQGQGTSTTVADAPVTTLGVDRLACSFIGIIGNRTIAVFSGETGGNWIEPIAEFASATGTIGLQTSVMLSNGTIDGGTFAITSAAWGVTSLALKPSAKPQMIIPASMKVSR